MKTSLAQGIGFNKSFNKLSSPLNTTSLSTNLKRNFVVGLRKRQLEEIPLWIKMLFVEKGMMHIEPDRMVD
jgi:hypothetical protein